MKFNMLETRMVKTLMLALLAWAFLTGNSWCQDTGFLKTGALYRAVFADGGWSATQNMNSSSLYVIKVVAISSSNPNWVLIEFPREANRSHNGNITDQRWINLNFVVLLKPYTASIGG